MHTQTGGLQEHYHATDKGIDLRVWRGAVVQVEGRGNGNQTSDRLCIVHMGSTCTSSASVANTLTLTLTRTCTYTVYAPLRATHFARVLRVLQIGGLLHLNRSAVVQWRTLGCSFYWLRICERDYSCANVLWAPCVHGHCIQIEGKTYLSSHVAVRRTLP